MNITYLWKGLVLLFALGTINAYGSEILEEKHQVASPSGNISITFFLTAEKEAAYQVHYKNDLLIETSRLGFEFQGQPPLAKNINIKNIEKDAFNETWEMPWGEQTSVHNHYNESRFELQEASGLQRKFTLIFRAFDDGVAFRYHFPAQEGLDEAIILQENTQFRLTGDHRVWWIPGDWDSYEHKYNSTLVSQIDALNLGDAGLNESNIMDNAVHTPVTMKTAKGVHFSIHEANLRDYASMTLRADTSQLLLESALVGSEITDYAVKRSFPFDTPWRTIQIGDQAGDLISSRMIENLNEPNQLGDVSWVKPMKYNGIWWEMHLDKSGWDMEGGRHGATTENAKRYIDFAAENNLKGVLVEGWNTGWDRWVGFPDREGVFDFVTPYEDYDLETVANYAREKGVELIMHHETSAAPRTYEKQMEAAYELMQKHGIGSAKLGYVGRIIPDGEHHHSQWMVNHYQKVLETAAKHQISINVHEPIKPTGLRRTYPNLLSAEGLRGQEFNAWAADGGNPVDHLTIVPFTRMLAGPIDYTPGIFNIKLDPYKPDNQVNSTLAQQLAAYVVIYSPVQMAADLPEHYEENPAFQFIRDVGVDWQQSLVLHGEVGEFVTMARKERETDNWFLGSITNGQARDLDVDFGFLEDGVKYKAILYRDAEDAHWDDNPTAFEIEEMVINRNSQITLKLASGGGAAMSIFPLTN